MPGPNTPYTGLDMNQAIVQSFDETTDRLRVDAAVTATIGSLVIDAEVSDIAIKDRVTDNLLKINGDGSIDVNVNIDALTDNIAISDGTNVLDVNPDGSINTRSIEIFTKSYDTITATYPSATVEVFSTRVGGLLGPVQEVATVTYTDASKTLLLSIVRV